MPSVKTEGIVLRVIRLGDSSRICTLYTKDHGKVKIVAKGARSPKSRFGAGTILFAHNQVVFNLRENRELHVVSRCELLREFRSLEADLLRLAHAAVAAELVDRVAAGEEHHGELFDLLEGTLARADGVAEERLPLALSFFALQLASLLGYGPRLEACASCGGAPRGSGRFGLREGGLLCPACGADREQVRLLTPGSLEILRLMARGDWEPVGRVRPLRSQARELEETLLAYLRTHALGARRLRSVGFLGAMRREVRGRKPGPAGPGPVKSRPGKGGGGRERGNVPQRTGAPERGTAKP